MALLRSLLNSDVGLRHPSVANCDEIYTVRKAALVRKLGDLGLGQMSEIDRALRISLDLD